MVGAPLGATETLGICDGASDGDAVGTTELDGALVVGLMLGALDGKIDGVELGRGVVVGADEVGGPANSVQDSPLQS